MFLEEEAGRTVLPEAASALVWERGSGSRRLSVAEKRSFIEHREEDPRSDWGGTCV